MQLEPICFKLCVKTNQGALLLTHNIYFPMDKALTSVSFKQSNQEHFNFYPYISSSKKNTYL